MGVVMGRGGGEQTFRAIMENKRFIEMKFLSLMTLRLKLSRYFASISIHLASCVDLFTEVFKVRSDVGSRACY